MGRALFQRYAFFLLASLISSVAGAGLASGGEHDHAVPGKRLRDCASCPEMVVIPSGTLVLENGEHSRTVTLTESFAMGRFEVTFEQWDACVDAGGCGGYRPSDEGWGRGTRPVMNVSWQDARLYAQWLSEKTGRRYRLPTEAEWEYAARGGLSAEHLKGDIPGSARLDCDNCVGQWANIQTAPVGRLEPNVFGLFDTHGNVWEWVGDCADCNCEKRILRGAPIGNGKSVARASRRLRNSASDRNGHAGFRVAMSFAPPIEISVITAETRDGPKTVGTLLPVSCGKLPEIKPAEIRSAEIKAECEPVKEIYRVLISEKPIVLEGAFFDTDSARLKPEGMEKLDIVAGYALKYPESRFDVTGHTDSTGSEAWNRKLSAARAASVKRYLGEKGVLAERITTSGLASTVPVASNRTKEGRAKNRRVEIRSTLKVETMERVEAGR